MNQRLEDRSHYNKEKMEIYALIKILEVEQSEILKRHADPEYV